MKNTFKRISSMLVATLAMLIFAIVLSGCPGGQIRGYTSDEESGADDQAQDQEIFVVIESGSEVDTVPEIDGSQGIDISFGDQPGDAVDESCLNDENGDSRLTIKDNSDNSDVRIKRVALRDENRKARITAALRYNKDYTLRLREGLCKEDGTTLDSDREITFRTLPNQCDLLGDGNRATFVWTDETASIVYAVAGENFSGERNAKGQLIELDMDTILEASWRYPERVPRLIFSPKRLYNMCNGGDAFIYGDLTKGGTELWYSYNLAEGFAAQFSSSSGTLLGGVPLYADLTGDGRKDFAILESAARGFSRATYWTLIFPGVSDYSSNISTDAALASFSQSPAISEAREYAQAGDVNGDGLDDLLIFGLDSSANLVIDIHYRSADGISAAADVSISPAPGHELTSFKLGDINGDGFEDIVVSLIAGTPVDEGRTAVVLGSSSLSSEIIVPSSSTWAYIYCETPVTGASSCGNNPDGLLVLDFDKDGYDDILISSALYGDGVVSLIYGGESVSARSVFEADLYFQPTTGFEYFGAWISSFGSRHGDVNGDGYPDFIVFSYEAVVGDVIGDARYTTYNGQDRQYGVMTENDALSVMVNSP